MSRGNLYPNNKAIVDQNQNIDNQINEFNYELNFINYSFNNFLLKIIKIYLFIKIVKSVIYFIIFLRI